MFKLNQNTNSNLGQNLDPRHAASFVFGGDERQRSNRFFSVAGAFLLIAMLALSFAVCSGWHAKSGAQLFGNNALSYAPAQTTAIPVAAPTAALVTAAGSAIA